MIPRARFLLSLALAVGAVPLASAQTQPDREASDSEIAQVLAGWDQDQINLRRLCGPPILEVDGCAIAKRRAIQNLSDMAKILGATGDRAQARDALVSLLGHPAPEVRMQALYGLARVLLDETDTPLIVPLLSDPVPAVRRAAWGALNRSTDPAARPFVKRVAAPSTGRTLAPTATDFDLTPTGLTLPEGAIFNLYDRDAVAAGGHFYLATSTTEDLAAHFLALPGARETTLADLSQAARSEKATTLYARFANAEYFQAVRVVAYDPPDASDFRFVAVFDDVQAGQPGFALLLPRALGLPDLPEDVQTAAAAVTGPLSLATQLDPSNPIEEGDDEDRFWRTVAETGGQGADEYLSVYPDGRYKARAEAFLTAPQITPSTWENISRTEIVVDYSNLPDGAVIVFLAEDGRAEPWRNVFTLPQPGNGTVTLVPYDAPLAPGVYGLGVFADTEAAFEMPLARTGFTIEEPVPVITPGKSVYAPGEEMVIRFAGAGGNSRDYLTVVKAGAPESEYGPYVYLNAVIDGEARLKAPDTPGAYEIRLSFGDQPEPVRARFAIEVTGSETSLTSQEPVPVITPGKSVYAPGEEMVIRFAGAGGNSRDYLTVVKAGAPESEYGPYVYLNAVIDGEARLKAPDTPGAYEIRLSFGDQPEPVRARFAITVQ